ncbi:MAG: FAD-binding oxidoreductase [Candidatus Abyssobacteria bacterium SURF_17]|uniref:FAD-binding oxidoreductase n=1 Tax=Candidatus Abyssobacteria bacterium SURF_17 TaxID=2093361 RepID=A0A419EY25_9BACT|nr:MAG: FAD-binding oxidoreductase [Candidatus Abyssubacteria bacterium SURF_17]
MTQTADAVIIGGGIVGASIAYHLASGGLKNTLVLEKQPLLGMGSSAASAGVIYHHLPEKVNLQLSRKSLRALLEFEDEFETKIDFRRSGCIQTAGTPEDMSVLRNIHEELVGMGVDARLFKPARLAELLPGIVADGLLGAIYTPNDGYFDPHGMIQGYAAAARRLGARFLTSTPAICFMKEGNRIIGVKTPAGNIFTEMVINAAGPAAAEVARLAGIPDFPVVPFKRQIFITAPTKIIPADVPFYFDKTPPFYFRPESGGLLMSIAELWECRNGDLSVDWSSVEILAERASRRFPHMNSLQIMRGWAGLREMTPDNTAILGPVPGISGFFCAVGFSGHGVMHAPITGRIIASMILTGNVEHYEEIDLAPLRYERFLQPKM